LIANSFELTINFLNSSITRTEKDTAIIINQSDDESTFVDSKPPISIPINGMEILANWTKKSNSPKDTKKAMLIALFEKAPSENILSS
jgi:hypothetical protein